MGSSGFSDLLERSLYARAPAPWRVVRVDGPDAGSFLQRICSQDVQGLPEGRSAGAAFLNPKGKVVAVARAARLGTTWWLETAAEQAAILVEHLARYHFTEKLEVGLPELECGEVLGADAASAFGLGADACAALPAGVVISGQRGGLAWVRWHAPVAFFVAPPWAAHAPVALTADHAEALRIAAAIPRVGLDIEASTLVLEAGLDDHVSTTKGCYTGQEIVARIHTYGHVNRRLCVLRLAAAIEPPVGTVLCEPTEGDPVGRLMSSAPLPSGGRIALGYLPKDFWSPGTELRVGVANGAVARVVGGSMVTPA